MGRPQARSTCEASRNLPPGPLALPFVILKVWFEPLSNPRETFDVIFNVPPKGDSAARVEKWHEFERRSARYAVQRNCSKAVPPPDFEIPTQDLALLRCGLDGLRAFEKSEGAKRRLAAQSVRRWPCR